MHHSSHQQPLGGWLTLGIISVMSGTLISMAAGLIG